METLDLNTYKSLNPSRVSNYLESEGWTLIQRVESVAAVWQLEQSGEISNKIFLPLDTSTLDYPNRMIEVVETLSLVEERPSGDILKSIQSSIELAQRIGRDVLTFKLSTEGNLSEFPAKELGRTLLAIQNLLHSTAQYEEGKAERSNISEDIKDNSNVSVVEIFKGSFGIKLAHLPCEKEQKSLLEPPLVRRAIKQFISLVEASSSDDKLREKLQEVRSACALRYKSLLNSLIDAGSDNYFEWAAADGSESGAVSLSRDEAKRAVKTIDRDELKDELLIIIEEAEWLGGVNIKEPTFALRDARLGKSKKNKIYEGKVATKARAAAGAADWNNIYKAEMKEISKLNPATGETKVSYVLMSLKPVNTGTKD